ncbi:TetR family transcriptional regulator [Niastella yeongjuensis]|uniref:TetR family transcriptional regulator n=1 Tax=Niastella yeongjuensis TaxID=354355 RepID=A0A1V9EAY3_9BACT|nr:TetR/AcrR family transcriptional regulator [Niastella yeongjuensis]OQP43134.1 TetR family transcriptional regulator [Niastella yeongjuensis]SEO67752.1 transcriptional regulator, TetR family [Niastella yeongjuensis]
MIKERKNDKSTEQKILEAAKQVFMEKGIDGARMQDIADKAGINKALLHYYFRSKEKLFEMIFMEEARKFMPKVTSIMMSELTLFEKIEKFVGEYIDTLLQNPLLPIFILNEINRNPKDAIKKIFGNQRPPIDKVDELITKLVKKGEIKPIKGIELMVNMVSMCIFPFLARPMVQWITKATDEEFVKLMEMRKKTVVKFVLDSIKK